MTSVMACHHLLWEAQMVERRRSWHAIIAFGQHKRSNEVGRGIPSSPLCSTGGRTASGVACHHRLWAAHRQTTSGVACHHRLWEAHTVERRQAWHAIIDFGQHKRSNDIWRGILSSPLGSTHGRKTFSVAYHHLLWKTHTVEQRRARHAITAFGKHTWSNDVRRGMRSSPLGSTNSRTCNQG